MKQFIQKLEKVTWSTFEKTNAKGKTPKGDDIEVRVSFEFNNHLSSSQPPIKGSVSIYMDGQYATRYDLVFPIDIEMFQIYWVKAYNNHMEQEFQERDDARNAAKMLFNEL